MSTVYEQIQVVQGICQIRQGQILGSCAWQEESKVPECPAYMNLNAHKECLESAVRLHYDVQTEKTSGDMGEPFNPLWIAT